MRLSSGLAMLSGAVLLGLAPPVGCSSAAERYDPKALQSNLRKLESTGLVIGEFALAGDGVLDGDTIAVAGLDSTLRLLGIDTEETFKKDPERRLFEAGWENYLKVKKGDSLRPVKMATPLGEDAKKFAKHFLAPHDKVRLERDHPKDVRGRFNRYLAYVFVQEGERWVNYNVECVRAGMSPYFTKYGYSRRFHDQFVAAQEEARAKRIGIWDPALMHYPDYEERLEWWNARADFVQGFEHEAEGKENYIELTHWDALRRLEEHVDQEVVLLGAVSEIKIGDRGPTRVLLARRQFQDFPLIFFDKDVFGSSRVLRFKGEFIRVEGTVTRYHNKRKKRDELQMVINLPGQIRGSERMRDYSGWNGDNPMLQGSDPGQEPEPLPPGELDGERGAAAGSGEQADDPARRQGKKRHR